MVVLKHEDWPGLDKITAIRRQEARGRAAAVDPVRPWRHPAAARAGARCRRRDDRLLLSRDAGRRLPAHPRRASARRRTTSTTATCRWSATSSSPGSGSPCASTCCGGAAPWPRRRCGRPAPTAERRDRGPRSTCCWRGSTGPCASRSLAGWVPWLPASAYDLVIRGGTVATATDVFARRRRDPGRADRRDRPGPARRRAEIDATGRLVLPGGVDSHCHIEQLTASGLMNADTFATATALGGVRRHHDGDPVRGPACRHEPDPGGRGLPRARPSAGPWSTTPST